MSSDVLTLREVAAFLKVHPNTIYRLARTGKLPAFKIGTDWRFQRSAVESWASRRDAEPGPPVPPPEDEVLNLINWMVGQGFALTVASDEIAEMLDWTLRTVRGALSVLVEQGLVTAVDQRHYALTPDGLGEARRRFKPTARQPSGHESVAIFAERFVSP